MYSCAVRRLFVSASILSLLAAVPDSRATWSIIIVDRETREVAIGSATCLIGINLVRFLPVVRPMQGAAAAQSFIDQTAANRRYIWDSIAVGLDPNSILVGLEAQDAGHQTRQYGIVDARGRAVTFTGQQAGAFADGIVGQFGSLTYAIQGNVITGSWVLEEAEAAILNTPGGIPEKLMAAMEAARVVGGDGRCSCDPANADACDPDTLLPDFKSAHVGFVIVARRGDPLGGCGRANGCAQSNYYLRLNIAGARQDDPDPVLQMNQMFAEWRADLVGVTDAIESSIAVTRARLWNDGASTAIVQVQLRDWQGDPPSDVELVEAIHAPEGSAGSSSIGPVVNLGGGMYEVELTAGLTSGQDRIAIRVTDSKGQRLLQRDAEVLVQDVRADLNGDGIVDLLDLSILLASFGTTSGATAADGDIDGDGAVTLADLSAFLQSYAP